MPDDRTHRKRCRNGFELALRNGKEHEIGRRDGLPTPKGPGYRRLPKPQGCRERGSEASGADNGNALLEQEVVAG